MSAKRLIPLLDRVLVKKVAAPEKSVGGLLLPETASKVGIDNHSMHFQLGSSMRA